MSNQKQTMPVQGACHFSRRRTKSESGYVEQAFSQAQFLILHASLFQMADTLMGRWHKLVESHFSRVDFPKVSLPDRLLPAFRDLLFRRTTRHQLIQQSLSSFWAQYTAQTLNIFTLCAIAADYYRDTAIGYIHTFIEYAAGDQFAV